MNISANKYQAGSITIRQDQKINISANKRCNQNQFFLQIKRGSIKNQYISANR